MPIAKVPADFIKPAAAALGLSIKELSKKLGKSEEFLYSVLYNGKISVDDRDKIKKFLDDAGKPFPVSRRKSLVPVQQAPPQRERIVSFMIQVKPDQAQSARALFALLGYAFDQIEDKT